MINNEINFVLKREDFFIEAFNLVEPKTIKKIYDAYHKNQNLKTFCKNIIDKYIANNHKDICQEIQEMKHRWGSCTSTGKIILNTELIKAPIPCIQYVVTHELCHLVHRDHTSAFFDLLTKEMPDWQRWKNKLECFMR